MSRLGGRSALVTGAGSGIGRAIALEFAREGAKVLVAELDEEMGRAATRTIEEAGGLARFLRVDVSRESEVADALQTATREFGRLDILVNNAGITRPTWDGWDTIMAVNLNGVFYGCRHGAEAMARSGGGSIVNIASISGLVGLGVSGAYVVSKHGVVGLTREFAIEYAARNVRVNCICPGFIDTPLIQFDGMGQEAKQFLISNTPMGRLGRPDEVAKAALFLASDESSYVTGSPLIVDGGWTAR